MSEPANRLPRAREVQVGGPFSLGNPFDRPVPRLMMVAFGPLLERVAGLSHLNALYHHWHGRSDTTPFPAAALDVLGIRSVLRGPGVGTVPAAGPLVVVANHPHGALDGLVLLAALGRDRGDVRLLGNHLLARIPELATQGFFVDVFGGPGATARNARALRDATRWVADGGALLVFPAGEVAHRRDEAGHPVESPWHPTIVRLIEGARATTIPAFIAGANSRLFSRVGRFSPLLRTALLPRELLRKRGSQVEVTLGEPVPWSRLAASRDTGSRTALLRALTLRLSEIANPGSSLEPQPARAASSRHLVRRRLDPVAAPIAVELVAGDLEHLPVERHLAESAEFQVVLARAHEIPHAMRELGRLREVTFRAVGEGTGRPLDLDRFDEDYWHVLLWRPASREIVGAYRLAPIDDVCARRGVKGLYTRTLFHYGRPFVEALGPALELGRSFVRTEYQRDYSTLALLWKGIGRFVCERPRYHVLYGPVSISAEYLKVSRDLLVNALGERHGSELSKLVRPRRPFDLHAETVVGTVRSPLTLAEVQAVLADVESDGKGMPILLRQYLKLNARVLAFNVDPDFSSVVDALLVVDLLEVDRSILQRYMGREGAARFLDAHRPGAKSGVEPPPVARTA